jgi:hypothetical protein
MKVPFLDTRYDNKHLRSLFTFLFLPSIIDSFDQVTTAWLCRASAISRAALIPHFPARRNLLNRNDAVSAAENVAI